MLPLRDFIPTRRFPVLTVSIIVVNIIAFVYELLAEAGGALEGISRAQLSYTFYRGQRRHSRCLGGLHRALSQCSSPNADLPGLLRAYGPTTGIIGSRVLVCVAAFQRFAIIRHDADGWRGLVCSCRWLCRGLAAGALVYNRPSPRPLGGVVQVTNEHP
jgi:hypothetical protein